MRYHFTYQTKNLVNGKTYIGVHSTNNLNDGYIGCGIKRQSEAEYRARIGQKSPLAYAVIKYGYANFVCTPLAFFDTAEEAYEEEKWLVTTDYIKLTDNYNNNIGGNGGGKAMVGEDNGMYGKKHSESSITKNKLNNCKLILDTETGIFYYGTRDLCNFHHLSRQAMARRLDGKIENNTNFKYV